MRNTISKTLVVLFFAALAACSATLPVRGQLADGSESFTGLGEAAMSSQAPFNLTSSNGTTCTGVFDMESLSGGTGTINCADGRTGTFTWTTSAGKLIGTGTLGGEAMTLTMG